jgi:hypothetical protein
MNKDHEQQNKASSKKIHFQILSHLFQLKIIKEGFYLSKEHYKINKNIRKIKDVLDLLMFVDQI